MKDFIHTLIKPDWDNNPKRSEILDAANLLQIGEFQLIQLAYKVWYKENLPEDKINKIFEEYMIRGIIPIENGERKGINTHVYTSSEIIRVAKVAFELAQKRNKKVTSCEKSNVMESGILWREEVQKVKDEEYPNIELSHMLADNCAMQLLRNPKQFDVIVTDNLFGDILSDEAAMLTGSLGLLPSASLGTKDKNGKMRSMYEPVHGSAPDIAGTGKANPIAIILSFSMALRYSLDLDKEADNLDQAVQKVLDDGLRTKDILSKGKKEVSTSQMGDAIISKLK